jgi:NitT/TauT family transport system permease protein
VTAIDEPNIQATTPRRHPRRAVPKLARLGSLAFPPFMVFVAVISAWYLVTYIFLAPRRRFLLPPPHQVVADGFLDRTVRDEIFSALGGTAKVALLGLGIASALGIFFAILMNSARWVERSFYPWAVVLQTIPILAIVPLIGFWLGYGFFSRTIVCVLIALFPIITNTLFGLHSVDFSHHDLFTLRHASRWRRLIRLELPSALPAVLTGLRISAGLSVIGAIVGDFFFRQGDPGIGRLIDDYTHSLDSGPLFATIIAASLLGLAVFWFFGLLTRLIIEPWHETRHRRPQ